MLMVHTADLHIGAFANRPLKSANVNAFEEIANYVIENDIKYLIIAGDFFERPRLENFEVLRNVYRILRRLRENGVYVICVPGSHDSSPKRTDILTLLYEAGLIYIPEYEIGKKLILHPLQLDNMTFYAIPGLKNNMETIYLRNGDILFKPPERSENNVVVLAHTSVRFAGYDPSIYVHRYGKAIVENENILSVIPAKTKYLALGHIHFPVPLVDEAEMNIAYPGAPIGRDVSDLEETYILRKKYGRDRRFLLIDISGEKTYVKSIWNAFNVHVEYYEDYYKGYEETLREIKRLIRDVNHEGYIAIILDIEGIPVDDKNKLIHRLREIEQQKSILIHLKMKLTKTMDTLEITFEDIGDIEEIEKKAIEEFVKRLGIKAPPEKITEIVNILSREKPLGVNESEFYEELFKELKPIMEEIFSESKD